MRKVILAVFLLTISLNCFADWLTDRDNEAAEMRRQSESLQVEQMKRDVDQLKWNEMSRELESE